LLGRIRQDPSNQRAWEDFVHRYGTQILHWCRRWNLQDADAQDVTQIVLTKLAEKLRTFSYDPGRSFRAYLKTLTNYALYDFAESRKGHAAAGGSIAMEALHSVEARADLEQQLKSAFDQELLETAMERVQARVEEHTWSAFSATALEGLSGAAAGERLNMKVATVFKARSKVQKLLQEEIQALEGDGESSP
jgi:RNA polymerase sigma-70 factor (ECF subfamily)